MEFHQLFKSICFFLLEASRLLVRRPSCFKPMQLLHYFPVWRDSLHEGRNPLSDQRPWISFAAADFLESVLSKDMRVFEYGSGGSTFFFADRVREVISVEHDRDWHDCVVEKLTGMDFSNCQVTLVEPISDMQVCGKSIADPDAYISDDDNYRDMSFKNYVSLIDAYPDGFFDVVIVDGRARPSCYKHAVAKIKRGGYFILDNAERSYYSGIHGSLNNLWWKKYDFYGLFPYQYHFSETCIWQKLS